MQITIFGSGYVGLVTGTCLAEKGNSVTLVDINEQRVQQLQQGECPIYEPGLEAMMQANQQANRLHFTTDVASALEQTEVIFVAVGTPADDNGAADLKYVEQVAQTIGQYINHHVTIANKSTVPVGTADQVANIVQDQINQREIDLTFHVASMPEFLKEGCAVKDCMHPDRIIIGSEDAHTAEQLKTLFLPFCEGEQQILLMQTRSAELTKYAANAMLATKISFINEISQIAERTGADIDDIRQGIGMDPRISPKFLNPGCGYGGSCFPKDVQALQHIAQSHDYQPQLLQAVHQVNDHQKQILFQKLTRHLPDLQGKTIAIWGLAFKPNTDDIREAPSRVLIEALWQQGAYVKAYDPEAMPNFQQTYAERDDYQLAETAYLALEQADALVIVTEWPEFKQANLRHIKDLLNQPVIVDGRNLFEPQTMAEQGFVYDSVGR